VESQVHNESRPHAITADRAMQCRRSLSVPARVLQRARATGVSHVLRCNQPTHPKEAVWCTDACMMRTDAFTPPVTRMPSSHFSPQAASSPARRLALLAAMRSAMVTCPAPRLPAAAATGAGLAPVPLTSCTRRALRSSVQRGYALGSKNCRARRTRRSHQQQRRQSSARTPTSQCTYRQHTPPPTRPHL
jgi:hypothetical protein